MEGIVSLLDEQHYRLVEDLWTEYLMQLFSENRQETPPSSEV